MDHTASGEVSLFVDPATLLWTVLNLFLLAGFTAAIILGVMFLVRLNRRVRRLEERLNLKEEK